MTELEALKITVSGKVQGVMFRNFILRHAGNLGLSGYVRNLPGGEEVEIKAEGKREQLEELLKVAGQGPPLARVDSVSSTWDKYSGRYKNFTIEY
jgi:acylphosphatase